MMAEMLRRVCFLSAAFAIASTLTDDEGVGHVLKILCTALLLICILQPVKEIDFESFALDMAEYRTREEQLIELIEDGEKMNGEMNRAVIEDEYASYIEEKAKELGMETGDVSVKTKWDTAGIWVPQEAAIEFESDGPMKVRSLKKTVTAQLGIPEERQTWIDMKK